MISGPVVVDASVVVEYVIALEHTASATHLFRLAGDEIVELWAPDLVFLECTSTLRRLLALKRISATEASRALAWLPRLPLSATGTRQLLPQVWKLRSFLTPSDAAYVALARELDAVVVSADGPLIRAMHRKRPQVVHISGIAAS